MLATLPPSVSVQYLKQVKSQHTLCIQFLEVFENTSLGEDSTRNEFE